VSSLRALVPSKPISSPSNPFQSVGLNLTPE
jgi:hypothetical protein